MLAYQQSNLSQGNWEIINSPTTENLNAVCFTDSLYGWVAGFGGTILHTTNGGDEWLVQETQTKNSIEDIFFIDRNLGWAIYWEVYNPPFGTYVIKTTDGGSNWDRSLSPQENIFSKCILFLDSLNGWMGGKPYPIVRTTNGGNTWSEAQIDSSGFSNIPVYDIQFYNSEYGYAAGGTVDCCGIVWLTKNGGNSWEVIDTQYIAPEPIYQLFIYDSISVIGVGGDFESLGYGVGMIQTSDGGKKWNFDYIGIRGVAWDIDFRTYNEAWAPLGGEQKLIYSTDYGNNWNSVVSPNNLPILKITFPDSLHGFGVGLNGAIIKYELSITNLSSQKYFADEGYVLEQNYPNPFNPSTKIKYTIPNAGNSSMKLLYVMLKVYDALGNEIATLVEEEKYPGNYEIEFDATGFPSGAYIYTLYAGNFISSKKMIILH
jgi:photosystem II stability/assembly factor-like uncharacterized protein